MPAEHGGGGHDALAKALVDRELGAVTHALSHIVARPAEILTACAEDQIERYLVPTVKGERVECVAMTEPGAGSDLRAMSCRARMDGEDFVVEGTKQFVSNADVADYVILFAVTGQTATDRGPRPMVTAFLVDLDTPGLEVEPGYRAVSNRGFHNHTLNLTGCRIPSAGILGELHEGFELAARWLGGIRLQVAAVCLGRARRAITMATEWAASRKQFGRPIGGFQGVSFKLADMQTRYEAAELLALRAAWKAAGGTMTDADAAKAKLFATEMCQFVTDEAIQIFGGMGLMEELPLERMWRDSRVDRIWDGTSEIQRHIISRAMLRSR
jgi:acyl-CoA dehydrogenase